MIMEFGQELEHDVLEIKSFEFFFFGGLNNGQGRSNE
jgi:hypothetical protein